MPDNFKENDEAKNKVRNKVKSIRWVFVFLLPLIIISFIVIFLCIMVVSVLTAMGIMNYSGSSSSSGGFLVQNNSEFWWPIGSDETTVVNGVTYASGDPVPTTIKSFFGYRTHPITGKPNYHAAIDIAGGVDGVTNIIAAKDGVVTSTNNSCIRGNLDCGNGLGNYVYISHADGSITRYIHLNKTLVNVNDKVKQGQVIGKIGSTGSSTGTHLDFQIKINGEPVDPQNYVSSDNPRPVSKPNNLEGKDNLQTICLNLKQHGYSDNAVAAILGNMKAESGFLPVNTNYLGCDGIVQWCFQRLTNLKNAYGSDWSNLNNQISFVIYELENSEKLANKYLIGNYSASEMAYYFCMYYERPGDSICLSGTRQNYANELLSYVQNGCN